MTDNNITGNALLVLAHAHIGMPVRPDNGITSAAAWLLENDYIVPVIMPPLPVDCFEYRLTDKGACFIRMIRALPEPVQSWIDPRTSGNKGT